MTDERTERERLEEIAGRINQLLRWRSDHAESLSRAVRDSGIVVTARDLEEVCVALLTERTGPTQCGVCNGAPLASGRECICGGVGTEQAEMEGLRRELASWEQAAGQYPALDPARSDKYSYFERTGPEVPGGFRVVADPTVPRDEVQLRDAEGNLLGKITGIGSKRTGERERHRDCVCSSNPTMDYSDEPGPEEKS